MSLHFSRKERKALFWIILLIVIMRISFAFRTEAQIYTHLSEDAYYLFSCAEHLAQGDGFTVDGVHPTNGVQPLVVALYAPLVSIANFDKLLFLRLTFGYVAIFDALTALLLALLVRSLLRTSSYVYSNSVWQSPPVVAAALWGFLYPVFLFTFGGLETGLYGLCLVGSLYIYAEMHRLRRSGETPRMQQWVSLGFMLGLTVLARIDAVMLVAAICLIEVYRYKEKGIGHAIVLGSVAVAVSSPWWIYNYFMFGSFMPQSGMAESIVDELGRNSWVAAAVLTDAVSVFFTLPKVLEIPHLVIVVWVVVIWTCIWIINRRTGFFRMLGASIHFFPLIPLMLTGIGFIVYYVFFFSAPHFIPRYFHPIRLFLIILASVAIPHIYEQLRGVKSDRWLFYGVLFVALAFSAVRYGYVFIREPESDFYYTGLWAQRVPQAKIGMDQAGTTGFMAPNVTNLDGKVNFEALQAKLNGDIGAYVVQENFDYIADWKEFANAIISSAEKHGLRYELVDSVGRINIYKRIP